MFELNLAELVEDEIKEGIAHKKANGKWAIRTESIIEMRKQGKTYPEISKELGIPEGTISSRISNYNRAKKNNKYTKNISGEDILSLRNQGKTFKEISKLTSVNPNTLYTRLGSYLNKPENKDKKNAYQANSKKNRNMDKQTVEILGMKASGMTAGEIANVLGIKKHNVENRISYYKNKGQVIAKALKSYHEESSNQTSLINTSEENPVKDTPKKQVVETQDEPKEPEEPKEQPKLTLAQRIKVLFTGKVD